jgi:hypothetical protein
VGVKASREKMSCSIAPTPTQSDTEGHEIPNMPFWLPSGVIGDGITLVKDQPLAPPVGSVETIASELLSTAAQAEVVGQEMPFTDRPVPAGTAFQLPAPLRGSTEVII